MNFRSNLRRWVQVVSPFLVLLNLLSSQTLLAQADTQIKTRRHRTPGTFQIDDRFFSSGPNGSVTAMAVDPSGRLFVAGRFTAAGHTPAVHVALWDGAGWHALGGGIPDTGADTGFVYRLRVGPDGRLYACGTFSRAGQVDAANIAVWDGYTWSAMGDGLGDTGSIVMDVAFDSQGRVYAAGRFTRSGARLVNNVAVWNGETWSALGSGLRYDGLAEEALAGGIVVDRRDRVYVGGTFNTAGSADAADVAMWDGSRWRALAEGIRSDVVHRNDLLEVETLVIDHQDRLFVGGSFNRAGQLEASGLAIWNGNTWATPGAGVTRRLPTGASTRGLVHDLAADAAGHVYVVGEFDRIDGIEAHNVARWDGAAWSPLASGLSRGTIRREAEIAPAGKHASRRQKSSVAPFAVDAPALVWVVATDSDGNVYAGGSFTRAGDTFGNSVARWNGRDWAFVGPAGHGLNLTPLTITTGPGGKVYVGGEFNLAGSMPVGAVAAWNGTAWDDMAGGVSSGGDYAAVKHLAADSKGNIYAAGIYRTAGGVDVPDNDIICWDGGGWRALNTSPPVDDENWITDLVVDSSDNLIVSGNFTSIGGVPAYHIARWDGRQWHALGNGLQQYVQKILVAEGGHMFTYGRNVPIGSVYENAAGYWNGSYWTEWVDLFSGQGGVIYDAVVNGGEGLYIGGELDANRYTESYNDIALWHGTLFDDTDWEFDYVYGLGSGISGAPDRTDEIRALAIDRKRRLYAGGAFTAANGLPASNLALWDGRGWSPIGDGTDLPVRDLVLDDHGYLWAIGEFGASGTVASSRITRWKILDLFLAAEDRASTQEDRPVTIDVLANDIGSTGRIELAVLPRHGAATVQGQSVRYTPAADFSGSDAFTYTISDTEGNTATAQVTVQVVPVNDPPSMVRMTRPENGALVYVGGREGENPVRDTTRLQIAWSEASDADGDEVTLVWVLASDPAFTPASILERDSLLSGTSTTVNYRRLDDWMQTLGVALNGRTTVYHRVVAYDDSSSTPGEKAELVLVRGTLTATDDGLDLPAAFALEGNYPNPFNPSTLIRFAVPVDGRVHLDVYDVLGRRVATLLDRLETAGYHTITWTADGVPTGLYFCRMEAGSFTASIPMVLVR